MRKGTIFIITAVIVGTLRAGAFASAEAGAFLSWGAGARSLGMGNTGTGITDDAYSAYWNPAAMVRLDRNELGTFHAILWEDTAFSYAGFVHPMIDKSAWGVSVMRLYSGGAEKRDNSNQKIGTFSEQQTAIGVSYGKMVSDWLSLGVSGTYASMDMDSLGYNALTFDGSLYAQPHRRISLGMNVQNVVTSIFGSTDDTYPLAVRLGAGYAIIDNDRLLIAADAGRKFNEGKPTDTYSIGVEGKLNQLIKVRLGRNKEETTAGLGLVVEPFKLDYAIAQHYLGSSHRVSFNYAFGPSMRKMRMMEEGIYKEPLLSQSDEISPEEKARREKLQEKFGQLYRSAIDLYRKGLYSQSLESFTAAQEIDKTDPDMPIYIERLNLIVPIVPQNTISGKTSELLRRGITYFVEGNGDAAVKTVAYALSTEPDNFTIARLLTRIEEKTGVKAEYTKPVSGMSIVDQKLYEGLIAFRQKDYSKVISLCEEVLVLEPRNVLAYKRLGSAFYALGEKEKALRSWRKALEIAPDPVLKQLIQETGKR